MTTCIPIAVEDRHPASSLPGFLAPATAAMPLTCRTC